MFQFLIGAIGRWAHQEATRNKKVSIPYWCDWKMQVKLVSMTQPCFNSLLVRLEVRLCEVCCTCNVVSIPYWCDWKRLQRLGLGLQLQVSIPYWCDWKSILEFFCCTYPYVSIPYWCDWKCNQTRYL